MKILISRMRELPLTESKQVNEFNSLDDAKVQAILGRLGDHIDVPLRRDASLDDRVDEIIKQLRLKLIEVELEDDQDVEDVAPHMNEPEGWLDESRSLSAIAKKYEAMDKDELDSYISNPDEIKKKAGAGAQALYHDKRTVNGTYKFDGLSELETIQVIKLIKALEQKLKTPILTKIDTHEIEKVGTWRRAADMAAERKAKLERQQRQASRDNRKGTLSSAVKQLGQVKAKAGDRARGHKG